MKSGVHLRSLAIIKKKNSDSSWSCVIPDLLPDKSMATQKAKIEPCSKAFVQGKIRLQLVLYILSPRVHIRGTEYSLSPSLPFVTSGLAILVHLLIGGSISCGFTIGRSITLRRRRRF